MFLRASQVCDPLTLSCSSVLGHHKLSEALIHCGGNCQPDVRGRSAFHGPGALPQHAVVCAAPDIPGSVLPLAGTNLLTLLQNLSRTTWRSSLVC